MTPKTEKIFFSGIILRFSNLNILHKGLLMQDWVFRLGSILKARAKICPKNKVHLLKIYVAGMSLENIFDMCRIYELTKYQLSFFLMPLPCFGCLSFIRWKHYYVMFVISYNKFWNFVKLANHRMTCQQHWRHKKIILRLTDL